MIGFLGTVTGMVQAFWEMANAGNNIDITLLSGGIYEAMITTVGGLIVGIAAMFAYNYLVTRVDKVVSQMEARTMAFMDLLNEPVQIPVADIFYDYLHHGVAQCHKGVASAR